ncbi:MAG: DNA topoisomerase III, partial [Firmicutes bacterium]|nr:DNA topoisomerase III [Bacillota bacterium]
MKKLVLAEKPSVARDFAKALGCNKRYEGYFEGKDYVITWAFGHLFTLKEPGDYDEAFQQWQLEVLPIVPKPFGIKLIDEPHVKQQFNIIREQLHRDDVEAVVIGTDAGREGELIARYILGAAKNNKPVFRLWLSSLTEQDILAGFQNLEPAEKYELVFQAAQARNELDWILGLNFTRAFTVKHGRKTLLSVGRCQTPVLAMIVRRDREIEQFKPEAYWELTAGFATGNERYKGKYMAEKDSFRISDQKRADKIMAEIRGKNGEIAEVRRETKKKPHPFLFNLTNLQRTLNRKYGYTAQEVLDTMQDLYEKHKILSYPRTAARHISEAMIPELPAIIGTLSFGKFKRFVELILAKDELPVTKRIADDSLLTDHTAIIPVKNSRMSIIYESLSERERNAFDEVALAFLAAFFPDYLYESTAVITNVGEHAFLSRGIRVVDDGWRQVYQEPAEEDEEEDNDQGQIPALEPGQSVSVTEAMLEIKKTKPPGRSTENSILALMENPSGLIEEENLKKAIKGHGIGTDATRAAILEVLVKRGFVERKK